MARKPQSRKTAKKRGGLRRRKTTAKRGGEMLSKQKINTDNISIADINGNTVKLGDLVEIKGSILTGTKNDGKYILFRITGSNVTFMGIPIRKGESMNGVLQHRPSVHIINMNYNRPILGSTVTKATDNTINIVNKIDTIEETTIFDSTKLYENYNSMVLDETSNYDAILQLKDKLPDTWEQFQEKVKATMVEKQNGEERKFKYMKNNTGDIVKTQLDQPTNAQPK
jgi:hypothetical protein